MFYLFLLMSILAISALVNFKQRQSDEEYDKYLLQSALSKATISYTNGKPSCIIFNCTISNQENKIIMGYLDNLWSGDKNGNN